MNPVVLHFPFTGWWLARNSPARRVPSHGSHLLGTTYSIDLIGVRPDGRTAPWGWRSAFATESNDAFPGFGRPLTSPVDGVVVDCHDGEEDHVTRRSQLTLAPYALGQAARYRRGGLTAITGNYLTIRIAGTNHHVSLCHLQNGSLSVRRGDEVGVGRPIGRCGNSGNSTQPHVHLQVTDAADMTVARGVPMAFRGVDGAAWLPQENEVFEV